MSSLKIDGDVNKELCHLDARERVAVVRVHVAADCLGQCAPNLYVLHIVCVEFLLEQSIARIIRMHNVPSQ